MAADKVSAHAGLVAKVSTSLATGAGGVIGLATLNEHRKKKDKLAKVGEFDPKGDKHVSVRSRAKEGTS